MIASAVVLVFLFVLWRVRRQARAARLSGTTASAPVFSVEPPARRHSSLKGEAL